MKLKTLKDIPINKFIQVYGVKLIDGKYDFIKELKQAAIEWITKSKRQIREYTKTKKKHTEWDYFYCFTCGRNLTEEEAKEHDYGCGTGKHELHMVRSYDDIDDCIEPFVKWAFNLTEEDLK